MVSAKVVEDQLQRLGFNHRSWGRTECRELPNILMPDEELYEVVNGYYEGGFALLVSTNVRVLLIDKKPMNYLTVEDIRFDMISEIDYSHRLLGARINISTGLKDLRFTSLNKSRLRKLITHVQHCMAEVKFKQKEHQEGQNTHLEQLNRQLRKYLIAQQKQQVKLQRQLKEQAENANAKTTPQFEMIKPSPELADYLYAQSLLEHNGINDANARPQAQTAVPSATPVPAPMTSASLPEQTGQPRSRAQIVSDLYAAGMKEVFGVRVPDQAPTTTPPQPAGVFSSPLDPLRIAYSKLPLALRNRRFGRPSFHSHSQAPVVSANNSHQAPAGGLS